MLESLLTTHDEIEDRLPPEGYKERPIKWILKLNATGTKYDLIATSGKMNVPNRSRSGKACYARLIDTAEYTLGLRNSVAEAKRGRDTHDSYRELVAQAAEEIDHPAVQALWRFVQDTTTLMIADDQPLLARSHHGYTTFELLEMGRQDIIVVEVNGQMLHEIPEVQAWWGAYMDALNRESSSEYGSCAMTGEEDEIAATHYKIRRFGSAISSYNENAYWSYGKQQSANAWQTHETHRKIGRTLSWLVDSDDYSYRINQTHWVFWTRPMTTSFSLNPIQEGDSNKVRELLSSYYDGTLIKDDTPLWTMCVYPISPGRISIRHMEHATVGRVQVRLAKYFDAMKINDSVYGSSRLLISLVEQASGNEKWNQITPWMENGLMKTALTGSALPYPFLLTVLNRNKALGQVSGPRAALIKLYLITHGYSMSPTLDPDYDSVAYQLGRLFAVLEHAQARSRNDTNSTITDKFFKTASTAPQSVFGKLLGQAQSHLSKLRKNNGGTYTNLQKEIGGILDRIPPGTIPKTLPPEAQAEFSLGYYHQREERFNNTSNS